MLTSYKGHNITYDQIGNPLSYYNGSSYTFTWSGRTLTGAVKGNTTYSFTYNDDGIRTSKTCNGVVHNYYLNGSQIIAEVWGNQILMYLYDPDGSPRGFQYRNQSYAKDVWDTYYFEKNLHGDIVAIYNYEGVRVLSYTYDAWGNFTSQTENGIDDPISYLNPFTYRGYYYDDGLGLYYLNSRYYDAKVGRFISADDMGYLGANGDLNSYNLYAYCSNNPVSFSDSSGNFPFHLLIGAAIGGIMGGVSAALSGEDLWGIILGTAGGIASGLLTASGFGVVGQVIGSTAISMSTNALTQFKNIISDETGETTFDYADMLFDGVVAGAIAIWGKNGASYKNVGGINAAWKQLFKKGLGDSKARSYFVKTAHNAKKEFVLKALFKSLGKNGLGTVGIIGKNHVRRLLCSTQ